MPVRVGTSFSPHRCSWFGISAQMTFGQVLELRLGLVRVSAYWDEIRREGYAGLDWLIDVAKAARQPILLTVGMKAIQWPEFYIPPDVRPDVHQAGKVGSDPDFSKEVLAFVSKTVGRYRDRAEIVAWQVENEPFNRSGPRRWWIDQNLVRSEIEVVRALDARPIVVNAFTHFDLLVDFAGRPRRGLFDINGLVPEKAILELLGASDVLGLDVYPAVATQVLGRSIVRRASRDWAEAAGRWLRKAKGQGNDAWIIECQAEPFESPLDRLANPRSFAPEDVGAVSDRLVSAGFTTVLLWGCEYWFWRAAAGDRRWLEAAKRVTQPFRR